MNSSFQDFQDLQHFVVAEAINFPVENHTISKANLLHGALFVPTATPCKYQVYPSLEMRKQFVIFKPTYYQGAITMMMFLFTMEVFIIYDCLVEHCQKNRNDSANTFQIIFEIASMWSSSQM
jgi:hypothetical protein